MSDQPLELPPTEDPPRQPDPYLENLEESTLERQSRSASYRDARERAQHLNSLNRRIDVLQSKLDQRESELRVALPRVAELEQAEQTSKVGTFAEAVGVGGGAVLLSVASFVLHDGVKFGLLGAGIAASTLGLLSELLFILYGWPK